MGFFDKLFGGKAEQEETAKFFGQRKTVLTPIRGKVLAQADIPDETFAQGILGPGCGIEPTGKTVYAPFDGTVEQVASTLHAVGLTSEDGIEILIHVGMDTVEMQGKGFKALVKVGALCGEAVVFPHGAPAHFMTMVKQQGALLAKGRLLGLQFDVLFTDDLYTRISRNAIETADRLKEGLAAKGYRFYMESPTNQVFPILANSQLEALEGKAKFGFWEKYDDTHTVMRIATSWATRMEEIEQLIALM